MPNASEDFEFDPAEKNRPPRSEGYKKETEQIIYELRNRGDQRIGQLILNALRKKFEDDIPKPSEMVDFDKDASEMGDKELQKYLERMEKAETAQKAWLENRLWNMEAPQLLEALKNHGTESKGESSP